MIHHRRPVLICTVGLISNDWSRVNHHHQYELSDGRLPTIERFGTRTCHAGYVWRVSRSKQMVCIGYPRTRDLGFPPIGPVAEAESQRLKGDCMQDSSHALDRGAFLNLAALVEAGLLVLAFLVGWSVGIDPLVDVTLDFEGLLWGVLATLPMFLLFLLAINVHWMPLRRVRQLLVELLGPSLALCKWYDLILLAMLAGVCEELLFRGLLQPWCISLAAQVNGLGDGWWIGVAVSSVLFGLAHWITPTYGLTATVISVYLGLLPQCTDSPNVLIPIVTHALYDYLAFLIVVKLVRQQQEQQHQADPLSE